jgi:hypothetical protein
MHSECYYDPPAIDSLNASCALDLYKACHKWQVLVLIYYYNICELRYLYIHGDICTKMHFISHNHGINYSCLSQVGKLSSWGLYSWSKLKLL